MPDAATISEGLCPKCGSILPPAATSGANSCSFCKWTGQSFLFLRMPANTQGAESALPDDATCIHHPRKKAVAICAGSGDYVCSLCSIEMNGQTYSAEYLNNAGKKDVAKAFDRFLPRPDSQIYLYLLCIFIPYVDFIMIPFAFLWIPHGFMLYSRVIKLRREDPLYRRLVGPVRMTMIPILLCITALLWMGGVVALVAFSLSYKR